MSSLQQRIHPISGRRLNEFEVAIGEYTWWGSGIEKRRDREANEGESDLVNIWRILAFSSSDHSS